MKTQLDKRARALALAALLLALLTPFFLPIAPDLRQHPVISPLGDRVHVAIFAVLTLVLHRHGPLRGRTWLVLLVSMVLGVLTELIQVPFGRSASVFDWLQDLQGTGLAACWIWWRRGPWRSGAVPAALLILLSIAWPLRLFPATAREALATHARFPLLSDFESEDSVLLWNEHLNSQIARVPRHDGGHALRIIHDGDDRWPGAASRKLAWNWTGQDTLLVDVRLIAPTPESLRVVVWMEDRRTARDSDYASLGFDVGHEWTTLRVPLADLRTRTRGRPLALQTIQAVSVFMIRRDTGQLAMLVDNVRLASSR